MPGTQIILGDWNSTLPAAPIGRDNIAFAVSRAGAIPKFSASIPRATPTVYGTVKDTGGVATFLIGIGAAIAPGSDVAPVYRVKKAGIISSFAGKAKAALPDDAEFMLQRKRSGTTVDILSANLVIDASSTAWFPLVEGSPSPFAVDDLEIGDELILNVEAGGPKDVTLELIWT
jgi:hypothetical protein